MLGKLGGHLGRKGDGEPGVLVLWRGWMWLYESVEMTARHHPESWSGIRRNAVMAWNTMKMQSVLDWNTRRSTAVPPEMIGRIAPTRTEGINLRACSPSPSSNTGASYYRHLRQQNLARLAAKRLFRTPRNGVSSANRTAIIFSRLAMYPAISPMCSRTKYRHFWYGNQENPYRKSHNNASILYYWPLPDAI